MVTEEAPESFLRCVAAELVDQIEPHLKRRPPGKWNHLLNMVSLMLLCVMIREH
jgi:hypothetical protein